ncbi:MAG: O-antigen ligase family protein [Candidatus Shapirobacteria bacterium]
MSLLKIKRFFLTLALFSVPFQWGRHFWPSFSYVLGLPVDYLSPTIYVSDVLFFASFVFYLRAFSLKIDIISFLKKYWWIALFLAGNIILALSPKVAFLGCLKLFARIYLVFFLVRQEKKWARKKLPLIICFWLVAEVVLVVGQFVSQGSLGGLAYFLGERNFSVSTPGIAKIELGHQLFLRAYGSFSHPNSLAGFALLSLFLFPFKKMPRYISFLVLLAGLACLFFSFSRTAWFAGFFVLLWPKIKEGRKKTKLFWFLLFALLAGFLLYLFPNPLALTERLTLAQASLAMFWRRPLLGTGWDNFFAALPFFWPFSQNSKIVLQPVHDLFLLIASQAGLAGLTLTGLILKKAIKKENEIWWLIVFLTGLTDHYWLTLNQNMNLVGIILGLAL